eukprot:CAMPEP_0119417814 /NCGR_PEP_ID=MMETSP1335-20130426/16740_1 /TAXON_ID=259385 /ORGANISM="Chrysoculter rhomboideus, Strain RCC1486" /LENGTH=183 /DNA_ID=CAMNT_0007443019 /DNA_START=100 /DNA_END=647 /DNA_ORIENTATION=-
MAHPISGTDVEAVIARAEFEAQLSAERAQATREHLRALTELHAVVAPSDSLEHGGAVPDAKHAGGGPAEGGEYGSPGFGLVLQYIVVGVMMSTMPGLTYGFFLGYLAVPGYVYTAASVTLTLPWSFKFVIGLISDTCPIRGLRRKPYMALGWALCALALVHMSAVSLPQPYWCVAPDGRYIKT